jgi:hypothetical protein
VTRRDQVTGLYAGETVMTNGAGNEQRLRDAGVIYTELPPEYAEVVANLSPEEVDVLMAVKTRLDAAADSSDGLPGRVCFAP